MRVSSSPFSLPLVPSPPSGFGSPHPPRVFVDEGADHALVGDALLGGFAFEEVDGVAAQREGHLHGFVAWHELVGGGRASAMRWRSPVISPWSSVWSAVLVFIGASSLALVAGADDPDRVAPDRIAVCHDAAVHDAEAEVTHSSREREGAGRRATLLSSSAAVRPLHRLLQRRRNHVAVEVVAAAWWGCRRGRRGGASCGFVAGNVDFGGAGFGAGNVEGVLHAQQGLHVGAESLVEADRHVGRKSGLAVQDARQGHAGDTQGLGRRGHGQAQGLEDHVANKATWMHRLGGPKRACLLGEGRAGQW